MKILLAAADSQNRSRVAEVLRQAGDEVIEVGNGLEALEALQREPCDLAVSDVLMPGMDGFQLCRALRNHPQLRDLPFVLLTSADTASEDEESGRALGADDFILKPLTPEHLAGRLHGMEARRRERGSFPPDRSRQDDVEFLRQHNERLIRQLEQKVCEVERAYAALEERETRLRAIIDTEPECVKLLARDGSLLEMNAAGLRMIEADAVAQVQYHCVYPLVVPEYRQQFEGLTERVFRGEQGTLEFEIVGLKGGRRWLESHASPLRNERGEISALISITRDITERKRAAAALAESESRYRLMFAACPLPMWMYDRQTLQYLDVNSAAVQHYGYTRGEFLEMTLRDIVPPEDIPCLEQSLAQHGPGLHSAGTWRHRKKDGTLLDVDIHADAVELEGRCMGLVLAVDVTQRCAAERALHELSARLLRLQDEERRRIARELHDTTSQNLAALSMNLSLLHHAIPAPNIEADRLLNDCTRLTDKCHQEVRTLSYLLHPPMLDTLGLPGALREYIDGFASRSGMDVQFQATQDFGRLPPGIETALFRVAQEAVGNIHRHSGSATAEVRLAREGGGVVLEISDSGRGIPAEKLRQFQDGLAVLGVGLAGMRERIHQLGGELEITSGPAGTRVRAALRDLATEAAGR